MAQSRKEYLCHWYQEPRCSHSVVAVLVLLCYFHSVITSLFSYKHQGWIDPSILQRTRALLEAANLPVVPPPSMTIQQFKELMSVDKKVQAGKLRLVLLKGPLGGCVVTGDFDPAKLDETLAAFCSQ